MGGEKADQRGPVRLRMAARCVTNAVLVRMNAMALPVAVTPASIGRTLSVRATDDAKSHRGRLDPGCRCADRMNLMRPHAAADRIGI
ncbi:hypothetical protein IV454_28965 [Massilia antarctica]|uniref:Uncharacterized protein n=1 Tax=Massilia antarctica TaxID=2765360 RepID=A0AA48WBC0_9BURK|nr:hypothetical protein [Massilia antarctica]QPI49425.1 hypothetical protein IV454_28965 [Massilia antarctica]